MQTAQLNQRFANEYLATLKNRDVPHERVYVIFSGVPGSGKTTLAVRLANDLKAQYIRHDDIRHLIRKSGFNVSDFTIAHISTIVIDTILQQDKNKLIVIDASLDRSWPRFFEHAQEQHAKPIVIRLDVPRSIVEVRVSARDKDDFGSVAKLDNFFEQFENSKKHVQATMTLRPDYDYSSVVTRIKELIE